MPSLMPTGKQQYFYTGTSKPLAGGKVYTYAAGTSTPKTTWQDAAGTTPNANPVVLDSTGSALIFWSGSYKVVVVDSSGNTIYTVDNYASLIDSAQLGGSGGAAGVGYGLLTLDQILKSRVASVVDSVAALRALDKTKFTRAFVTGYYAAGDGGGGPYYLDATDTTSADNSGTIIVATDGGRWKLQPGGILTVRQFGAKGDGTTDDTSAIQAALNALPSTGGALYFPGGVYKVSLQFTIANRSNIRLYGPSFSGSYNATTLGATIQATGTFTVFSFSNGVGCSVESMQIRDGGTAIYFNGCLGFRVLNCNLFNNQIGMAATGNGVGIVRGNMVRNNTIAGLQFLAASGDTIVTENDIGANNVNILVASGGIHIHNNLIFFSNNSGFGVGVLIDGTNANADAVIRRVFIHNNLIGRNDLAIKVLGTSAANPNVESVIISENHIHQDNNGGAGFDSSFLYGQGISVAFAKYVKVRGNQLIGMRDYAVLTSNCLAGVEITNNNIRFTGGTGTGISCFNMQWGRIAGNDFTSNVGTAIAMTGGSGNFSQNNSISHNTFQSNGAVYTEDVNSRANVIYDNLGGVLTDYSVSSTTPLSQVRHVSQGGNQVSLKNQNFFMANSAWNGTGLPEMGSYVLWVDAAGRLRIKSGLPTSDTDGTIVGAQS
jgi:hypothetical protein